MTKNNIKLGIFAIAMTAALMASPLALSNLQADAEVTSITRNISEEEFRETQIQVLDLRSEQNALERQILDEGTDNSEEISSIDGELAKLMPILDKHQEQNYAKHFIEPAKLEIMKAVENDLRNQIGEIYSDNTDRGSYIVLIDTITKEIKVSTSNSEYNTEIESIISKYPSDAPIVFGNHEKIEFIDFACTSPNNDCDPIVGGVEIEGDCTLGLPVKKGWWPFQTDGYVTAGHCLNDNDVVNQPDAGST
ncbi:MAG: hypothetical protein J4F36_13165 [Nitrosopumilaceae archaeon]|nr:hypothetical protein [Nitrosopumilaceae archaeon]